MTIAVSPERARLTDKLAEKTVQLAFGLLTPAEPKFARVVDGKFGNDSLAGLEGTIARRKETLEVILAPKPGSSAGLTTLKVLDERLNEPVSLRLEDQTEVRARLGCCSIRSMEWRSKGEVKASVKLLLDDWVHTTTVAPSVWLGRLAGARFQRGNVSVQLGTQTVAHQVLRLEGRYIWHLVKRNSAVFALIGARSDAPGGSDLNADFGALQFTLGCPLRLSMLLGIDCKGHVVAGAGVGLGFRRLKGIEPLWPPVPPGPDENWLPALFSQGAAALKAEHSAHEVLLAALLDSMVDHLDGAYLKLQVGIEAYCKEATQNAAKRPLLVQDIRSWKKWVDDHESEIRRHARDDEAARILLNKLLSNVPQPPSSDAVKDGLAALNLSPPADLVDETKRRSQPAHNFRMSRPGPRKLPGELLRVRRLQALAAALLAHGMGYRGPVVDLANDQPWPVPIATWLPATADPEQARRRFHCAITTEAQPSSVE